MGRQLPIVATATDERELLNFIKTLSPIGIYVPFAGNIESLWIDDCEHQEIEGCVFSVWLKLFAWQPAYEQTGGPRCPKERARLWYVSNGATAPVIEISRPLSNSINGGRVYWARDFAAPNGLAYDATAFGKYVDQIWNWIRRKSRRQMTADKLDGPYFLPEAWEQYRADK